MDGKTLTDQLRQLLEEDSSSTWIDLRTSYDFLYEAVCEFVKETNALTATQTITAAAETSDYTLNADYSFLYLVDDSNRLFVRYTVDTTDYFIPFRDYDAMSYEHSTTSVAVPSSFSIRDKRGVTTNITGTVTSATDDANGESALTDTGAAFLTTVNVGDTVHNTVDGSSGIVVSITSNSVCQVALFGGTDNEWDTSDTYVIIPQGRKEIVFSPPFSTTTGTVTVEYVQKPIPVYSLYKSYRLSPAYAPAIVKYATWLYKYRDREPSYADSLYKHWDMQMRKMKATEGKAVKRLTWRVNFKKNSNSDRAIR
jgi:hypothetical protein